ncbi:methyl-accepting chemotaxis protein [Natronoarchaeum philippinense]|uniref:Methyl-accepting chemotaxis protein n=1 Tax=Natronoarchaeum philippinense TaxID=558529 RepID=A0A285P8K4_NATPI|nr:methyl-accepting chemotaxis protein [Natronoarchaeum philippinense]SNZ18054.1 methyl-accepting chemotaxis protein [Natronoarchaeum philippinense]
MLSRLRGLLPDSVRNSYPLKVGAALVAVILLVSAVGGVVYAHTGDTLRQDTQQELETAATSEADRIDQWLEDTRFQQSKLASSHSLRIDDGDEIQARLATTVDQHDSVRGAYHVNVTSGAVLDVYGHGLIATGGSLRSASHERVRALNDPSTTVTTATVSRSELFRAGPDGSAVFLFVSNVETDEHRAVVSVIDAATLSEATLQRRSDGETVVVNDSGTVVLALDESRLLQSAGVDAGDRPDGGGFFTAIGDDGAQQAVGYAGLTEADWTTTASVPTAAAYALQSDISRGILAMVLVATGGALAIALTIGRNTVRSVRDLSDRAAALEAGDLDVDLETERTDEFGRLYDAFGSMRDSLREQIRAAESAREAADRQRAESEQFARNLETTADEYGAVMSACADGDLTRRIDPDDESEAMATVGREFNDMLDQLEATVAGVARFAEDVAVRSEQVTAGAADVRDASERVTDSIQEISEGAERQHAQYETVSAEMQTLAASVQQVATSAEEVADIAEQTAETGREGRDAAEDAIAEMDAVEHSSRDAVEAIDDLQSEMEEIEDVVELITELAEQTNLVALNASIEAARTGDGDREGFGVVADEVRSLADETKAAATDIEERIESIRDQTTRTASEVRAAADDIRDSAATVRDAADAFEGIDEHAAATNQGVQEIRAATSQQAATTEEVVSMADEAATVSEATTAEAETVAAAAEEQTSTMVEVADNASGLADRADSLRDALERFETRASVDGGDFDDDRTPPRDDDRTLTRNDGPDLGDAGASEATGAETTNADPDDGESPSPIPASTTD